MAMVVLPHNSLRGELVMISPNYEYFGSSIERRATRRRLYQARSLPEVESTAPLYIGFLRWANPVNGRVKMIFAIGIEPDQNPFTLPGIADHLDAIRDPESVLFDTLSQNDYGPVPRCSDHGVVETEAERKRVRVTGLFTLGHTFAASAVVVMSDEAYFRIRPDKPRNMANVGMIGLKPGADPDAVAPAVYGEILPRRCRDRASRGIHAGRTGLLGETNPHRLCQRGGNAGWHVGRRHCRLPDTLHRRERSPAAIRHLESDSPGRQLFRSYLFCRRPCCLCCWALFRRLCSPP